METYSLITFLREAFRGYYMRTTLQVPDLFKREFGFGVEKKIDYRHKAFGTTLALNNYLRDETPLFASYSTALYNFPAGRPMERKGFLGSDLVFDIDNPSKDVHAQGGEGTEGKESPGRANDHNEIFCMACFGQIKKDAVRLARVLRDNFGFADFSVNFSGNKGFHFHLRTESVRGLTQDARRQLVDFLQGPETVFHGDERNFAGPNASSGGWPGAFYRFAAGFLENASAEEARKKGLRGNVTANFEEKRGEMLKLMHEGKWRFATPNFWQKLYAEFRRENSVSVDANVTLDLHRLIRIPDSLHGDTGLIAKTIKPELLEHFDPREALAFDRQKTIKIRALKDIAVEFPERVSLEKNGEAAVAQPTAIFLLCKRKAVLAAGA